MPDIPVQCFICDTSVKESEYVNHMTNVHGTLSQSEAMAKEKNISKQQSPIVLDKEAPPSAEFMEVAKMLDEKPPTLPPSVQKGAIAPANTPQKEGNKPIVLKYKYEGSCPTCNTPVRTIVVRANGQTVAVALCLDHGEAEQREVPDLEENYQKAIMNKNFNKIVNKLLEDKPEIQIRPKRRKRGVKKHE